MRFGIVVYEGVEPIDVGATFGVLSMARRIDPGIEMFLVAERAGAVRLAGGLDVVAGHGFDDGPAADVYIVTGGPGWSREAANPAMLGFVRRLADGPAIVASVCTGAMVLAAAGLLDGRRATTKSQVAGDEVPPLVLLGERHPSVEVVSARIVDDGAIVTGGGVSLAIDLTLHLIERVCGARVASETARIIEYAAARRANAAAFGERIATAEQSST